MLKRICLAGAVALASVSAAGASDGEDCRQAYRPEIRLKACTRIIEDASTAADARSQAYRFRGEARANAGALDEALADYTRSLALKPEGVAALSGRGLARLTAGNNVGALEDYDAAIRVQPRSAQLYLARGHIQFVAGHTDAAIADLTEAIRLNPKAAIAYNNRGLAYRRKGLLAEADTDYTAAIALNPIYALAYANRGHVRELLARRSEAVEDLKQALLLDPSLTDVREDLKRLGQSDAFIVESDRRVTQGQALVESNCSRCHAVAATGDSPNPKAPVFRTLRNRHPQLALREPLTRGIAAQHDEMPRFTLSVAEIDAIVAYIGNLSR